MQGMSAAKLPDVVTYDGLPASAGGAHSLRSASPVAAWQKVHAFTDSCVTVVAQPKLTFLLRTGGPEEISARLTALARRQLGGPRHRAQTHIEWGVRPETTETILEGLQEAGPDAVTQYGHPLAALSWSADVRLIDPASALPYEGISPESCGSFAVDGYGRVLGASGIRATVGTTASTVSVWLCLPGDDRLPGAAKHLQEHLPFKLSTKHWRRWRPSKNGAGYASRKMPSPVAF